MLLRHKIPTIFNIYMLDVICCALGCVVLLWQVAHQEAETQTDYARKRALDLERSQREYEQSDQRLQATDLRLQALLKDTLELRAALNEALATQKTLSQALASTQKERDDARKIAVDRQDTINKTARALDISKEALKKLEDDLAKWVAAHDKISKDLAGKEKISTELLAKLVLANREIDLLKKDKDLKLIDLTATEKRAKEQTELLRISRLDAERLQKLLDSARDDSKTANVKLKITELTLKVREEDLDRTKKELTLLLTTRDSLQKELVSTSKGGADAKGQISALTLERDRLKDQLLASNQALGSLRLDKDKLSKRLAVLEADLDQRFAGIPLTGENVVFLIDISGSMAMKDPDIADPDKWPFLCDTLMKLMKSIPTLQRFQIILFSDKTTHLFGNRDHWLKYGGPEAAKQARDALLQVKVEGGTNMHDAFEEAFRYRKIKLDTIYLFSDGLPNIGPGVPSTIVKATETQKNLHMAKFLRDKLRQDWNAEDTKLNPAVRLNAVGFYFESPDVGAFLWALAREHKGNFVGLR